MVGVVERVEAGLAVSAWTLEEEAGGGDAAVSRSRCEGEAGIGVVR
jgi:hypothetical protein